MNTLLLIALLLTTPAAAEEFPSWMTGTWTATVDGVRMEEHWTDAGGNLMLGLHRDIRPNGKVFFEFLRIEKRDGKLAYVAQPGGRPATVFPLQRAEASRITFENRQHDFPQRVIYWRDGTRLCARVEGSIDGKEQAEQWCWSLVTR